MKKVIVSLVMLMGLSFNASAGPSVAGLTFQPWSVPLAVMLAASQVEYKACNNAPYKTVSHASGSNYTFSVSECEIKDNRSAYKVK